VKKIWVILSVTAVLNTSSIFIGYGPLKEERSSLHHSHGQHHQLGSNPSIYSGGGPASQHSVTSLENNFSPTGNSSAPASRYWETSRKETGEDLYSWMAKQQDFMKDSEVSKTSLKGNWVSVTEKQWISWACNGLIS
jgi:hypothetical protein